MISRLDRCCWRLFGSGFSLFFFFFFFEIECMYTHFHKETYSAILRSRQVAGITIQGGWPVENCQQ